MKNILFIFLVFSSSTTSTIADSAIPGPLISADWLANNADDVVILDTRKDPATFTTEGHIENAVLVDVKKIRMDRDIDGKKITRMRPDAASFQTFMREHGINNSSQVVITHRGKKPGQVAGAARLYWQMKYYGFDHVALLDGGNAAWVTALEDLTNETLKVEMGNYKVGKEHPEILATMLQVKKSLDDSSTTLLDTRELRYHIGVDKKDYVFAYGHILGAKNLPYKFLTPAKGDAVYYDKDKLNTIVDALHIDMNNSLIMFCNSAYECASVWFVLHEILGKKDVRIYDGSLHQWTQYEDNPMVRELFR